jgi:hypothetical protein
MHTELLIGVAPVLTTFSTVDITGSKDLSSVFA